MWNCGKRTGASIHSRSVCSSAAQPATLYPDEAQQPRTRETVRGRMIEGAKLGSNVLNIADMGPRHGLISCLSGRLIFKRATDCRRIGFTCVDAPLGAILGVKVWRLMCASRRREQEGPARPHLDLLMGAMK